MRHTNQKAFLILSLFVGLFLLFFVPGFSADQPDFPNIYVDSSVAPGGVGSEADPYSDFSEINWTTGGDNSIFDWYAGAEDASVTINLKEGEEWREILTVGASGSATYPIIIQAYGTGADPIINGADVISTWTAMPTGWQIAFSNTPDGEFGDTGSRNYRNLLPANTSSHSGTKIRITASAGDGDAVISAMSIGVMTVDDVYAYEPGTWDADQGVQVTWDTGNIPVTITSSSSKVSDEMTLNFDKTLRYGIHVFLSSRDNLQYGTDEAFGYYYDSDDRDDSMLKTPDTYNDQSATDDILGVDKLEVYATGQANTWQATLVTTPEMVFFDESGTITWGDQKGSIAACVNEYDWYYDSVADLLYVYAATDPDDRYTSVEASLRSFCIDNGAGVNYPYITIQDLECKYAIYDGILVRGTSGANHNVIVDNCIIHHIGHNNSEPFNEGDGVELYGVSNCTIKNSTIYECGLHAISVFASFNATDDNIIEYNTFYGHHYGSTDFKVDVDNPATLDNNIFRYNYVYWDGIGSYDYPGVYAAGQDGNVVSNLYIYYNVFNNVPDNAVKIYTFVTPIFIYNNTISETNWATTSGIRLGNGTGTATVKNNVIYEAKKYSMYVADSTNKTIDNNCSYLSGGWLAYADGAERNWAWWQGTGGFDTNGLNVDPKLVDFANDDFRLLMGSPCINAGTDVGLTKDYRGRSIRHAPDIGAYEDPTNVLFMTRLFNYLKEVKKNGK